MISFIASVSFKPWSTCIWEGRCPSLMFSSGILTLAITVLLGPLWVISSWITGSTTLLHLQKFHYFGMKSLKYARNELWKLEQMGWAHSTFSRFAGLWPTLPRSLELGRYTPTMYVLGDTPFSSVLSLNGVYWESSHSLFFFKAFSGYCLPMDVLRLITTIHWFIRAFSWLSKNDAF